MKILSLKKKEIISLGGGGLLTSKYNSSAMLLITTIFSEYEWLPWKFKCCPLHYWDDKNNHKLFMNWVANQLNVKEMNDWYKVTGKVFFKLRKF